MSAYHKNALQTGSEVAEYRIESVLGHGGFGITYLAQDTTLSAQVAIKEFLPHQIAVRDEKSGNVLPKPTREAVRDYHWGLKNFVKEARALAQFKHPNIVRVLRFLEANGTAYMVMEYEKGESLAQHLKAQGPRLDEAGLLRIFIPTLNGLHAVHEAQMLHLDIKPENIYLRTDGSPMLIDFGSARQAFVGPGHVQRIALTHGYAPLEQYPDKGKQGPWTDIYAIGASMYRCTVGKQPDDSLERYQAFLKYKVDPLTPASKSASKYYQPNLLECIDWAMQIYPNDRPQSARALQDALIGKGRQTRKPATITGPATFRPSSTTDSVVLSRPVATRTRSSRYRKNASGFLVLLLVVSVIGAALYFWPSLQDRRSTGINRHESPRSAADADSYRAPPSRTGKSATPPETKKPARDVSPPVEPRQPSPPTVAVTALSGHSDWVTSLAFSSSGLWFVSGSNDKTLKVWEASSGKLMGTLRGHGFAINGVAVSPDDSWIASAGNDGSVRLWDVKTGTQRGALQGQGQPFFSVAFSPDGKRLAAAGRDRTVYIWEVDSGKRLFAMEGHKGDVNAVSFSHDGQWLATGSADRTIRIWNLGSGKEQASLAGHKDGVLAVAYSPDGRWLASGDNSRTLRVWDGKSHAPVRTVTESLHAVLALAFSHDSRWLAVGEASKSVQLLDPSAGSPVHMLDGHQDFVHAVAFSPDGRWLITGGRDQHVRLWKPAP